MAVDGADARRTWISPTLKAAAARDIALAFGVPPMLLGLPGDNTYANYREANRALWRLTLLPLAGKILGGLAEGLGAVVPGRGSSASISTGCPRWPRTASDCGRRSSAADFLSDGRKARAARASGRATDDPMNREDMLARLIAQAAQRRRRTGYAARDRRGGERARRGARARPARPERQERAGRHRRTARAARARGGMPRPARGRRRSSGWCAGSSRCC